MSQGNDPNAAVSTERLLSASPRQVFAAFEQPEVAAKMRHLTDTANESSSDCLAPFSFSPRCDVNILSITVPANNARARQPGEGATALDLYRRSPWTDW